MKTPTAPPTQPKINRAFWNSAAPLKNAFFYAPIENQIETTRISHSPDLHSMEGKKLSCVSVSVNLSSSNQEEDPMRGCANGREGIETEDPIPI